MTGHCVAGAALRRERRQTNRICIFSLLLLSVFEPERGAISTAQEGDCWMGRAGLGRSKARRKHHQAGTRPGVLGAGHSERVASPSVVCQCVSAAAAADCASRGACIARGGWAWRKGWCSPARWGCSSLLTCKIALPVALPYRCWPGTPDASHTPIPPSGQAIH